MKVNYLYLDDERPEQVRAYVEEVMSRASDLSITHSAPQSYASQMDVLRKGDFDGLILDLRLDQFRSWQDDGADERADYRATTIAQECRTRATEGKLRDVPLVLWSTDQKLNQSYYRDDSSHDLFDLKVVKDDILDPSKAELIGKRLRSLAQGYVQVNDAKRSFGRKKAAFYGFLGFAEDPEFLDGRLTTHFDGRKGGIPVHVYARFILREVLEVPGVLLGVDHVAARFGLGAGQEEQFENLLNEHLAEAEYNGPFCDGWRRWWAPLIDRWWSSWTAAPLRPLGAADRVSEINRHTGLEFAPARPLPHCTSTAFWTLCEATGAPLDPKEGFLIADEPLRPWQLSRYISLHGIISGRARERALQISPLEVERVSQAKLGIENE